MNVRLNDRRLTSFAMTAICTGLFLCCVLLAGGQIDAEERTTDKNSASSAAQLPQTVEEARARARLLHETIHGTLQVVHRDFFEEESRSIPSHSLEDVFSELERSHQVHVRWLAVNAKAMNVDNEPQTDFEKEAVKALSSGQERFEAVSPERYQFVGAIRLSSQCLKCHLPARSSNAARTAGLVVTMPLRQQSK